MRIVRDEIPRLQQGTTQATTMGTTMGTAQGESQNASGTAQPAQAARGTLATKDAEVVGRAASDFVLRNADKGIQSLDALWEKGEYARILDTIDSEVAPFVGVEFNGLSAVALISLSSTLFVFEERVKAVINKLSMTTDRAAKLHGLNLAKDLANIETSVFRRAVERQDAADPHTVTAWIVARDTRKKPDKHERYEQLTYAAQKTVEFYMKGGQDSQVRAVDAAFLQELRSGQLAEYVVDAYDVARAAVVEAGRPSPGHTVLARGGDALTAGTFEVQKDAAGRITQILVGTFSGHFRTGLEQQEHLVRHLVAALGQLYPDQSAEELVAMIVRREGQATNPRTIEVLGRAIGMDGADAQRQEAEVRAEAMRWHAYASKGVTGANKGGPTDSLATETAALKDFVVDAIKKGAFLAKTRSPGDAATGDAALVDDVIARLDALMAKAVLADNALLQDQLRGSARALLAYAESLETSAVHHEALGQLRLLKQRWQNSVVGTLGADLGLVLSPPPVADRTTRIIATIDTKAVTDAQLRDMIAAGVDVARFNTAHGTTAQMIDVMKRIRTLAAEAGRTVTIQVDLEGPKIRLRTFENPQSLPKNDIWLQKGERVHLTSLDVLGNPKLFPVDYPTMTRDVKPGSSVSMNDGTVQLRVVLVDAAKEMLECEVLTTGKVWDRKGVSFPDSPLSGPTVTQEDLDNLTALLPFVDSVAQSFVESAADIRFLRDRMRDLGRVVTVIAKIERKTALDAATLREIALAADALMVARGDLGVEVGFAGVPRAERSIVAAGEETGRPVILATEVLMSMLFESRPSRGDVEGLYAAVHDRGVHAIMFGKETSAHAEPGDVIRAASNLIAVAEQERGTSEEPAAPLPATTGANLFLGRR